MSRELHSLSVVVPVYNEAPNVEVFFQRLTAVLAGLRVPYQIVVVDDGSTDRTSELIPPPPSSLGKVEVLRLSRNFGHQMALTAGLEQASAEVVITMDGDLQHPPELIPELVDHYLKGSDLVYTVRISTEDESFLKRWTSRFFYQVFNSLSPVTILEASSDFRLASREALEVVRSMPERHRFLRALFPWSGYSSSVVKYQAAARHAGVSKYPTRRMLALALDAALSFSRVPLQLASLGGCASSLLCAGYCLYALWAWYAGWGNVVGWTSLIATILFIGSLQLFFLGILGEYVGRIYEEVKRRPLFVVRDHRVLTAPPPEEG